MSRNNRYYPSEFKREALGMLATGEHNMAQLERELGITPGLLRYLRRNAELRGEYTSPNEEPMNPAAAEARIRQLKRRGRSFFAYTHGQAVPVVLYLTTEETLIYRDVLQYIPSG